MSQPDSAHIQRMDLFHDGLAGPERRDIYQEIWRLAWPAFMGQGINAAVMVITRVIVGQLGEEAYNGVNVGIMVFFVIITVVAAVGVGTTALVAQAWGSGDKKKAGHVLQQSLLFGFALTVIIAAIGPPLARVIYNLIGADPETVALGTRFLSVLFVAIPVMAPGFFLAAALRGAGDTRTPMIIGIIMGGLSLFLSYGLILGKLGMPRLETLGAALAIDGAFFAFTLILAVLFIGNKVILKIPRHGWRPDFKMGVSIFRIGIPSAAEWVLIQLGIIVYIYVIYRYGKDAAAGYFTGVAILGFAQTPAFGFQTASTTLVGQMVGARDFRKAESAFRHCVFMAFMLMAEIGALLYFIATPGLLSMLFDKLSPASIAYARTYTILLIFVMPLMGVSFTIAGGLRGAGDTVPPLIASTVGVYGGRILSAFAVYYLLHQPPIILVWCSMFPDLTLRIALMALRLASGKWKVVKV
ncbi:MAG TPA: MATE family efflux transporter [bacterium]|nr:MATE family efflux transporter [bacterium]